MRAGHVGSAIAIAVVAASAHGANMGRGRRMTDEIVIEAGGLRMAVDARGRMTALRDAATGADHLHPGHAIHILML